MKFWIIIIQFICICLLGYILLNNSNKETYSNRVLRPINRAKNTTIRNIKASFTNPTFSYALNRMKQLFI
jgi:hypothetical protein